MGTIIATLVAWQRNFGKYASVVKVSSLYNVKQQVGIRKSMFSFGFDWDN